MVLSEELQTQAEAQSGPEGTGAPPPPGDSRSLVWRGAIRCAALAGSITAGLMLLSVLIPPVLLLTVFWIVISPVVVIGIFQTRYPLTQITAGFGARLGLLTGLSIALVLGVINTSTLLLARFAFHTMGDADKQMTASVEQFRIQAAAAPGDPLASLTHALSIPEFRAGFLFFGLTMVTAILLAITTVGGAFAGFARSRPRA